jgi:hypothetical protein
VNEEEYERLLEERDYEQRQAEAHQQEEAQYTAEMCDALRADLARVTAERDGARQDTAAARDELGAANARWIKARNERDTWRDRALRAEADLQNMLQGGHSLEGMG